jgi:hypothetical protein
VDVVVAEHTARSVAETAHKTQGRQRLVATVDQVTSQPKTVTRCVEVRSVKQCVERVEATLHISYNVGGHECFVMWLFCGSTSIRRDRAALWPNGPPGHL